MKDMKELLHSAHLTKTQKIIAEYVLDNASEACFMTSTEIALKLGVSESSVIRFSRTIGFDGFMDFQKALRKDYQDKVLSISSSITVPSQRIAKQAKLDTSSDYTTGILRMPHITWKKSLFRILSRHLSRLLISLSPASTNILQQQEAISVLRISFSCI